jgi:hypothetical protein
VLVTAGLLDRADGASPRSSSSASDSVHLDWLTAELAKVLGPVAALVIDDEVSALGEVREAFPRRRIEELIDRVGQAVQDQAKRARFQQVARDAMAKQI